LLSSAEVRSAVAPSASGGGQLASFARILEVQVEIGRERVTDERAPVVFEDPQHIFLTKPNKVEPEDFDGWIQERGLYFPSRWDEESYNVILTSADAGNPQIPGLVFARYGRGTYVYTTFVWYRQLRHLNPAAMKVVANMISYPWW